MFEITLNEKLQPKQRPRFGKYGNVYTPKKTVNSENAIKYLWLKKYEKLKLLKSLVVTINYYHKCPKIVKTEDFPMTTKPDIDNIIKTVLDALNDTAYKDDSQVVGVIANKKYGKDFKTVIQIQTL